MSPSSSDYFSLFGLPARFAIDPERLRRAYDEVLALVHPDRHVRAGASERRAAMQLASTANEAYRVLKSDSARAAYLCGRHGVAVEGAGAAPLPAAFLEQQLHWREMLEQAQLRRDAAAVAALAAEVAAERAQVLARLAQRLDEAADYAGAAAEARALLFLDKLGEQAAQIPADA